MEKNLNKANLISGFIFALITMVGIAGFFYPFFISVRQRSETFGFGHRGDAPFFFLILVTLVLVVILSDLTTKRINTRVMAILGVTIAINVALRFIPLPLGASLIWILIIISGYVFGASFGFLAGALTILVSAFFSGGFGPWVPFQMFAAGWIGAGAALIPIVEKRLGIFKKPKGNIGQKILLSFFGIIAGYLFGALMNLWFWPYIAGEGQTFYQTGSSFAKTVKSYSLFYLATSFIWDSTRALSNLLLILVIGVPLIKIYDRFKRRFEINLV